MKIRALGGSLRAGGGSFRAAGCSPLLFLFMGSAKGGHFFYKHGHVAYQIEGDDEQNRMQVPFSS